MAAILAVLPVWRTTLGTSWNYACWQGRVAYACDSLGDLSDNIGWTETEQPAYHRACELGVESSCRWLLEDEASTVPRSETCDMLQETCHRWRRCKKRGWESATCSRMRESFFIRPEFSCTIHEASCER